MLCIFNNSSFNFITTLSANTLWNFQCVGDLWMDEADAGAEWPPPLFGIQKLC